MDQNKPEFSKAENKDFAKFFESEVGQKYIKKLKVARDNWLISTMTCDAQQVYHNVNVAEGITYVINDIVAGIEEAKADKEKK